MKSVLCEKLGIDFPLFVFSRCRDAVAAVMNAGGHDGAKALATCQAGQARRVHEHRTIRPLYRP